MKMILDTAPGADDAIALFWALGIDLQYRAEVVALTTADGNLNRRATYDNACRLLAFCQRDDIKVARAAPHPGAVAAHIHGKDALAGQSGLLPDHRKLFDEAPDSPQHLVRQIKRAPGEITLITFGPVTNLAAAEKLHPGILAKTKRIILAAGAFGRGNITEHAEFNVHYNPVAFHDVLNCGANLTLIPLDITRQFDLQLHHLDKAGLTDEKLRIVKFMRRVCAAMGKSMASNKKEPLFFVHDACAIGYALYPDLFEAVDAKVEVETRNNHQSFGRTTIHSQSNAGVTVLRRMDASAARTQMLGDILTFAQKIG